MKSNGAWIALIVGEVIALCCCVGLVGAFAFGGFAAVNLPTPTLTARRTSTSIFILPSLTIPATGTPAPTNTLVIQPRTTGSIPAPSTPGARTPARTATLGSLSYNIVIPTPTAPTIVYPVDFTSSFVVTTYGVGGSTVNALSKSLEANALSDPHEPGSHFYARTDWYLASQWNWKETLAGCEVDRAQVTLAITMTLPALTTTPEMPNDLLNRWNTFIANTQTHETGHVKLAEQGARDYQRDLGNFPPASDCSVIKPRLRDLYDKSFSAIDKANVNYDAQTQHGFTQGAVFP